MRVAYIFVFTESFHGCYRITVSNVNCWSLQRGENVRAARTPRMAVMQFDIGIINCLKPIPVGVHRPLWVQGV